MHRLGKVVLAGALLFGSSAFAQETPSTRPEPGEPGGPTFALSEADLVVTTGEATRTIALPCRGTSLVRGETHLFITCDDGGVAMVDLADPTDPRPTEVRRFAQPVARVFLVGGIPWAEMRTTVARPLVDVAMKAPDPLEPEPKIEMAPETAPAQTEEEPAVPFPLGRVIAGGVGEVTIDLGRSHGVARGDHIEMYAFESEDLGGGEFVEREVRQSIGTVASASENRARVTLGLNEQVTEGAHARETSLPVTGGLIAPERYGGLWEAYIMARPFLALGTLGGGAFMDGSLTYRMVAPVSFDLIVTPFGFGIAEAGDILAFAGNVFASYDTTPFQIGLGAGVSKINTLPASPRGDFVPDGEDTNFRAGFSAAQFVRLGARDGLHLTVLNNFILYNGEFGFGGLTAEAQVPVRLFVDHAWIVARGGGGVPGQGFGEFGIRLLAVGNGGPGSLFLTPTVGGGVLFGDRFTPCEAYYDAATDSYFVDFDANPSGAELVSGQCREEFSYGGPLIGFGVEWRL